MAATLPDSPVRHSIVTTRPPIVERPRRLTGDRLTAAKAEFAMLLDRGIIWSSSSQWTSPLNLVPKKDVSLRARGDYRRLNACTIPDRYPLPVIEDLHEVQGQVFSKVDLQRAFYRIPVAEKDIPKTAVTTPFGLFDFVGMPLGLRNSTETLQRTMDHLLRKLPFVKCYLDDLFVASQSHKENLDHLRQVLETLRAAKLKINLAKCAFGKPQIVYLGYVVTKDGFKPPQQKIEAIESYPRPEHSAGLRRFLGMVNYYRRCIPRAADLQAPLHDLLKGIPKKGKLSRTTEADIAFQRCKSCISEATRTAFLSSTASLVLRTDASSTAIGAALEQQQLDGTWNPIGFFSRKLSAAETRYSAYDRELSAAYSAVKHFSKILDGRSFTIRTDHRPLVYTATQRSDKASPRQSRHLDYILQFSTQFSFVKGEDNVVADALSRTCTVSMPTLLDSATIKEAQETDAELQHLSESSVVQLRQLEIEGHDIFCEISTGAVRPYVPSTLCRAAFDVIHGIAHPSGRATARHLAGKFFWPGLRKDAHRWSQQCEPCQRAKIHRHNRTALGNFDTPDNRFDHIHVDLIKLPLVRGFQYCLTVMDRFSRWPLAVPLQDIQAVTVAKALFSHWICIFATPLTITSDQGMQFVEALFFALAQLIGAKRIRTTPYHSQSNGMVKRLHRTLKAALMCSPQTPWIDLLPTVLLGMRTTFKGDLQASPAEMLFGVPSRVPGEFFVTQSIPASQPAFVAGLRSLIRAVKPVPASRHTEHHPFIFKDLQNSSHVFRRLDTIRKPLEPPYTGPHRVVRRVDGKTYVIDVKGQDKVISTDALKPAYLESVDPPADRNPQQPSTSSSRPEPLTSHSAPAQSSTKPKRISFPSLPAMDTEGGDVAPKPQAPSRAPAGRRKQTLLPRPIY